MDEEVNSLGFNTREHCYLWYSIEYSIDGFFRYKL